MKNRKDLLIFEKYIIINEVLYMYFIDNDALVEGGLKKVGAKAALKIISKQVLKKAIPYVGWAIAAVDFVACIVE